MARLLIFADSKSPGGRCRSCGAPVTWAELTTGKRMPFDPPIVVLEAQPEFATIGRVVETVDTATTRSHFATCPQAKQWRRRT